MTTPTASEKRCFVVDKVLCEKCGCESEPFRQHQGVQFINGYPLPCINNGRYNYDCIATVRDLFTPKGVHDGQ